MSPQAVLRCLALSLLLVRTDGFVVQLELDCSLSSDGKVLWANWTLAFNKMPLLCYDNGFQEFVPCGLGYLGHWDGVALSLSNFFDQQFPNWGKTMQDLCREQTQALWVPVGDQLTPPNVRIFPITPWNTPAPVMLACDVWGFYPADVTVTWLRNGAFMKSSMGVPVLSNGDWTYQTRLTLPAYPQPGDTYTCRVDHAGLREPLNKDWEPGLTPELKIKVGVSSAVLGVGIVFLIAGLVCWNKRMPEGYAPLDGNTYPPVGS